MLISAYGWKTLQFSKWIGTWYVGIHEISLACIFQNLFYSPRNRNSMSKEIDISFSQPRSYSCFFFLENCYNILKKHIIQIWFLDCFRDEMLVSKAHFKQKKNASVCQVVHCSRVQIFGHVWRKKRYIFLSRPFRSTFPEMIIQDILK